MNVKVYGGGCARCAELVATVAQVIEDNKVDATVEKVTDMGLIASRGIISTPSLEVDGKIVSTGRIPSQEELQGWLGVSKKEACSCSCGCGCGHSEKPVRGGWRRFVGGALMLTAVAGLIVGLSRTRPGSACCSAAAIPAGETNAVSQGAAEKDVTTVYYFHGAQRCMTCNKIEAMTRAAVKAEFKDEVAAGKIALKSVNLDEAGNEHFVQDFQLSTRSVVVQHGAKFERLDKVWQLVHGDEAQFQDYIVDGVRRNLGNAK